MCNNCNIINKVKTPVIYNVDQVDDMLAGNARIFSQAELDEFIEGVFSGKYTIDDLPQNIYDKTGTYLATGVGKGYGKGVTSFIEGEITEDTRLLQSMYDNVYKFSAAKTYQQTRALTLLLLDANGNPRPFSEFARLAKDIVSNFNRNWLGAEYNTSIAQARSASLWKDIQDLKKEFPLLKYTTVGDARVRPTHRAINHIIRPVDDPFWDTNFPPNGWRCRCTVFQESRGKVTKISPKILNATKTFDDLFKMNAGKQKIVFKSSHPYNKVPPKDKKLKANNFNEKIPPPDEVLSK